MKPSLQALLAGVVDYAGTFPPARLGLGAAVQAYARYRAGGEAWMLGRFVLPLSKAAEFDEVAPAALPPSGSSRGPSGSTQGRWPLSLILSAEPEADLERVDGFRRAWAGRARVDSLEAPPLDPSRIAAVAARLPRDRSYEVFFEVVAGPDLEARLEAIGAAGAGAKVRTGGLDPQAFPSGEALARFVAACARARVAFKATAGLHHAYRGSRPVSPDAASPLAPMHGFVNLAVASALVFAGKAGPEEALRILGESSADAFQFEEEGVRFGDWRLDLGEIAQARRRFFRSFGACSFEEPVADLEEALRLGTA